MYFNQLVGHLRVLKKKKNDDEDVSDEEELEEGVE
jgi:hypothetical protein